MESLKAKSRPERGSTVTNPASVPNPSEKLMVVVDGNNIALRAHHALMRSNFTTTSGVPTGALFGTIKIFLNIVRLLDPDYMIWFFDCGKSKKRTALLDTYKGNRKHREDSLPHQLSAFEKFLSLTNTRFYREAGVEADDLMAASVHRWDDSVSKVIVTADHDLRQLVSSKPRVSVLKMKQGRSPQVVYNEKKVLEEYGLPPSRLPDLWALTGDSSDNIPGVKGVGPKRGLEILQKYPTLEDALLFEPRLDGWRGVVERNLELIKLDGECATMPVEFEETQFSKSNYDEEALLQFFEEWEINSLRLKVKGPGLYA